MTSLDRKDKIWRNRCQKRNQMLLEKVGNISEHIELLGSAEIPFYLVKGKDWAMIDAGISPAIPTVFEQMKNYPELDAKLKQIILTHSHFDHTGGLAYLLGRFPAVKVVASRVTAEVFGKPKAVEYIKGINQSLAKFAGMDFEKMGFPQAPLRVDQTVKEGDRIDLGDRVSLSVYDAPGHSRCSVAYLLNPERALFSGEAIGFYNSGNEILPEALSSFNDFIGSLEKLGRLNIAMICLPHGGVLTDPEVKKYFPLALEWAGNFRAELEEGLQKGEPDQEILGRMADKYYRGKIKLQPREVFIGNLTAMLIAHKKEMTK